MRYCTKPHISKDWTTTDRRDGTSDLLSSLPCRRTMVWHFFAAILILHGHPTTLDTGYHSPIPIGNHWESHGKMEMMYRSSYTCHVLLTPSLPLGAALRWWVAAALWVVAVVVLMQTACRDENMP